MIKRHLKGSFFIVKFLKGRTTQSNKVETLKALTTSFKAAQIYVS
jgi:hypothetical protein